MLKGLIFSFQRSPGLALGQDSTYQEKAPWQEVFLKYSNPKAFLVKSFL